IRQLRVNSYAAACRAMNIGGLSEYSSLPRWAINQLPLSTMCLATRAKRGSSAGHGSRRPMPAPSTIRAISMNHQNSRRSRGAPDAGSKGLVITRKFDQWRERTENQDSPEFVENLSRP